MTNSYTTDEGEVISTFYKVVREYGNKLLSAWVGRITGTRHDFVVEYKPNEWVFPRVGPLMVFGDLNRAAGFALGSKDVYVPFVQLWKCEVENPQPVDYVLELSALRDWHVDYVRDFWNGGRRNTGRKAHAPEHSYTVSKLRMIERVEFT
jgi:hypothetical protein